MSENKTDHVAEATTWLNNAIKAQLTNPEVLALAYAAIAQTHATLALAEQQRIANLQVERGVQAARTTNRSPEIVTPAADLHRDIEAQIREGLRL